jgi:ABC-type dipeptide/oligopeptide/nickel transport system permease component
MRYFLRRLMQAAFLLIGVSILTFLFSTLAPGNYFDEMRLNPQISPETVAALRAQYQLDRPLPVRYARWVNSLLRGEMGFSFAYNSPVAPLLWVRARNTLLLTFTATLIAWALALPLGIWSATTLGGFADRALSWATAALLVIPDLVLALGLLILAVRSGCRGRNCEMSHGTWNCRFSRWYFPRCRFWFGTSVPQWQTFSMHLFCEQPRVTAFRKEHCFTNMRCERQRIPSSHFLDSAWERS